jgi:outer membrane lipoprotein-sorting protein
MKSISRLAMLLISSMAFTNAGAQDNELGWTMDSALKQIDRQASDVESVLAQVAFSWGDDAGATDRIDAGRIYINRKGDIRINEDAAPNRVMLVEGGQLQVYDPSKATVTETRLSREKARLEPYIRVGFTVTGRDLKDQYLVTFVGEQVIGDRRTLGLELTPKRDDTRAIVSKLTIWFDQASWLPVRQELVKTVGGQTVTADYSGVARNLNLNPDLFRGNWPRGTKKVRN